MADLRASVEVAEALTWAKMRWICFYAVLIMVIIAFGAFLVSVILHRGWEAGISAILDGWLVRVFNSIVKGLFGVQDPRSGDKD